MKGTVDRLQVIRSGNTIRGPEVWEDYNPPKIRDLEREIGVLNLATVTLVETDGKKILIDVSWEGQKEFEPFADERNRLVTELKYFGIRPVEIDEIFITHWHGDHWESIFPCSHVLCIRPHRLYNCHGNSGYGTDPTCCRVCRFCRCIC
ncbi:MAG: MBL fold metallo-hydrolase [Candidatus Thorarchaeota archaeon]